MGLSGFGNTTTTAPTSAIDPNDPWWEWYYGQMWDEGEGDDVDDTPTGDPPVYPDPPLPGGGDPPIGPTGPTGPGPTGPTGPGPTGPTGPHTPTSQPPIFGEPPLGGGNYHQPFPPIFPAPIPPLPPINFPPLLSPVPELPGLSDFEFEPPPTIEHPPFGFYDMEGGGAAGWSEEVPMGTQLDEFVAGQVGGPLFRALAPNR